MDKAGQKGQLQSVMGNEKQERLPDKGVKPTSPANIPDIYAGSYVMSLGLFRLEKYPLDSELTWDAGSPEVWLIQDLVTASGGELGALREWAFEAGFTNLLSAILCARRIQWALQGLSQHEDWRGTLATILIHSAKPEAKPGAIQSILLGSGVRGKILVEMGASADAGSLAAVVSSRTAEPYLEVLWADNLIGLDPEFVKSALRIPEPPDPDLPVPPVDEVIPESAPGASYELTPSFSAYDGPFGPEDTGKWNAFKSRKWLIAIGSSILVVLLVIVIVARAHNSSQAPPVSQAAPMDEAHPQPSPSVSQPPPPPSALPATDKSSAVLRPPAKISKHEPKPPKIPKPQQNTVKASKGSCDFSDAEIERSLKRADNNLHAGKFSEASQAYRQVAECPSARDRAQRGIASAKQKMTLQGVSNANE